MRPVKNISCNYLLAQFVCLINVYAVNICNIYHRNIFLIRLQYLQFLDDKFCTDTIRYIYNLGSSMISWKTV